MYGNYMYYIQIKKFVSQFKKNLLITYDINVVCITHLLLFWAHNSNFSRDILYNASRNIFDSTSLDTHSIFYTILCIVYTWTMMTCHCIVVWSLPLRIAAV